MIEVKKEECTFCKLCMVACSAAQEAGLYSEKCSCINVIEAWPEFEVEAIHVCIGCDERSCIAACPEAALSWDGRVMVAEDQCTRCGACVKACSHGGVTLHPITEYPMICNTCDGEYQCTQVCPTGAISIKGK